MSLLLSPHMGRPRADVKGTPIGTRRRARILYLCEFLECNYSTASKQEIEAHDHFHDIAYDRLYEIGAKVRVIKGKQGHLEQFMVVPLEALLAIFKYMGPGDLWNLARVNKRFRSLLLNRRKALSIWQAAFDNVHPNLPPCPSELNLVKYAALLFGRMCDCCGSDKGSKAAYRCLSRLCEDCYKNQFIGIDRSLHYIPGVPLCNMVPFRDDKRPGYQGRLFFRPVYERHRAVLHQLEIVQQDLAQGYAYRRQEWSRIVQRQPWVDLITHWEDERERIRKATLDARRRLRKETILDRICALGYAKELDRLSAEQINDLPGMLGKDKRPLTRDLTDKEWESYKPVLVNKMETVRAGDLE